MGPAAGERRRLGGVGRRRHFHSAEGMRPSTSGRPAPDEADGQPGAPPHVPLAAVGDSMHLLQAAARLAASGGDRLRTPMPYHRPVHFNVRPPEQLANGADYTTSTSRNGGLSSSSGYSSTRSPGATRWEESRLRLGVGAAGTSSSKPSSSSSSSSDRVNRSDSRSQSGMPALQSGSSGAPGGLYADVTYISGVVIFAGAVITLSLLASVAAYVLYARHEFSPGWFSIVADIWRQAGATAAGGNQSPDNDADECGDDPPPAAGRPEKLWWNDADAHDGRRKGRGLAGSVWTWGGRLLRAKANARTTPAPCIVVQDDSAHLLQPLSQPPAIQPVVVDGRHPISQQHRQPIVSASHSYDNGSFMQAHLADGVAQVADVAHSSSSWSLPLAAATHARLVETTDEIFV